MNEPPPLRWRVLGDLEVLAPGARPIGGPAQRRTFGALIARRNETVGIDQIVDACWPVGEAPDRAEHNVRTYVHRLRSALGELAERLGTSAGGYRLVVAPGELDIDRYLALTHEVDQLNTIGDASAALDRIEEAEALWRGRPYAELADEAWALGETSQVTQRRAALASARVEALLAAGRSNEAVGAVESVIADQPLAERPRALLMRALYESGRQPEALRVFQEFRRLLIDDVGVEPSRDLVDLDRTIASGTLVSSLPARVVGNYELHERIGEGAFAVVHRATQASLDREVALKIVRAELANRPDFIRRFESEAQMVAAIEHPNVVPLYDFWREPGNAYLVMRWMSGGSLEQRLDRGPLDLGQVVDVVDQIAAALDAAHRHDIVHRDVKPANILFDDAGRAFLGDFGIALAAEERSTPQAALSEGSPIFASPEQLRREPAGPEADVHALGVVAYTALTGHTPFHDIADEAELLRRQLDEPIPAISTDATGIPAGLDEVLAIATAKRPTDRYPTAGGFATAFRAAATGEHVATPGRMLERDNPYLGLRAFSEADAGLFKGRDRLVDELLDACADRSRRLVTVVGPSGSGKSSVVRAGLVPALRAGRAPGSSGWFITSMIPGARPYEALERALLRVAVNPPTAMLDQLCDGDRGIHRAVSRIVPDDGGTVLLVIDQFEELFTATDDATRRGFLRSLAAATTEPGGSLRVVATMRADFYDRPLRHPEFAPLFTASTVAVTPLAPDELEEAITAPAAAVGVRFEPGLVAAIVADVNDQPGALPLLQFALTQLFEAREDDTLGLSSYERIGALAGALGGRAESLHAGLTGPEQVATRRTFGRLVALGEGTEDTRRRVRRSELVGDPAADRVLDVFGDARLLTFDRDAATREPTVEIAHEALIREWPRLRGWLDEDRDGLRIHRHITEAAGAWNDSGRDPGELYRGGRLAVAAQWVAGHASDLNAGEHEFVTASIDAAAAAEARERARIEAQVRANRRLRALVAVTSFVAVIAAATGLFALQQRSRANDQSDEAIAQAAAADRARRETEDANTELQGALDVAAVEQARAEEQAAEAERQAAIARDAEDRADLERLNNTAVVQTSRNPTLALLLAVEAYRIGAGNPTAADSLQRTIVSSGNLVSTIPGAYVDLALIDAGRTAVAQSVDDIQVWDLEERELVRSLDRATDTASEIAVSPQARLVAVGDAAGLDLVDVDTGAVVHHTDEAASALRWSPDGDELAVMTPGGQMQVWSVDDPSAPSVVEVVDDVVQMAWHPNGRSWLLVRGDGPVEYVDRGAPEPRWTYDGLGGADRPVLFDADATLVVVALTDGRSRGAIHTFSLDDGSLLTEPIDQSTAVEDLEWIDEERLHVAVALDPGRLAAWDLRTRTMVEPPIDATSSWALEHSDALDRTVEASVLGIRQFGPAGTTALSTPVELTPEQRIGNSTPEIIYALSPDGRTLYVNALSGPSVAPPNVVAHDLLSGESEVLDVAGYMTTNGDHILLVNDQMVVLDGDLRPVGRPVSRPSDARSFNSSPDGRFLATFRSSGVTELYSSTEGLLGTLTVPGALGSVTDISFSADGERVAVYDIDGSGAWAIYDTSTLDRVAEGPGKTGAIWRPWLDGDTLYANPTGIDDRGTILRLDPESLAEIAPPLRGHTASHVRLLGSDELIATTSFDGTVRVWDRDTGLQIGREIATGTTMSFSHDGSTLVTLGPDGLLVWNYDVDTWADVACDLAGRNLTREEWDAFGPRTIGYRATCEQYPPADT